MQFFTTTSLAVILAGGLLFFGRSGSLVFLFCALPFGASAACGILGSVTLPLDLFVAVFASLVVVLRDVRLAHLFNIMRPGSPGIPLNLLLIWTTWGAVAMPLVFAGQTEVFELQGSEHGLSMVLAPLDLSTPNLTQLLRLILGVNIFIWLLLFVFSAPDSQQILRAVFVATVVNAGLVGADMISYALGHPEFLSALRTMNQLMLSEQRVFEMRRIVGGFAEPAALGAFSVGLYGYWLRLCLERKAPAVAWLCLLVTAFIVLRTTSLSAWTAMACITLWALVLVPLQQVRGRLAVIPVSISVALLPLTAASAAVAYTHIDALPKIVDALLLSKLTSASGIERADWNAQAFVNLIQTWGLGAGIGSVRASSWLMSTLASLGVIGTALYLWFLATVFVGPRQGRRMNDQQCPQAAALLTGCAAILLQAMLTRPYPDLGVPFFSMAGIATGLRMARAHAVRVGRNSGPAGTQV